MEMEDLIVNEPVIITISSDDYIKRMPMDTFREQRRGGQGVAGMHLKKEDDCLKELYVASTHDYLMIFTNTGRCYWVKVWQLPETGRRSKGKPIVQLLEGLREDEKIATVLRVSDFTSNASILLATKQGVVKRTVLEAFSNPRKKGVFAINIDEGDEVIAAHLLEENDQIMLFTNAGMAVRFNASEARPIGRIARGVRGISLRDETDRVVACEVVKDESQSILIVCEKGFGKRSLVQDFRQTRRGGLGVRSIIVNDSNGQVLGARSVKDGDSLLLMSFNGQAVRMSVSDLRIMGRATQGVKLAHLKGDDTLVGLQKIDSGDIKADEDSQESCEEVDSAAESVVSQVSDESNGSANDCNLESPIPSAEESTATAQIDSQENADDKSDSEA